MSKNGSKTFINLFVIESHSQSRSLCVGMLIIRAVMATVPII